MNKILLICLFFTTIRISSDPRFGIIGDGAEGFANSFALNWYTIEGNQVNKINSFNKVPINGKRVVREVAKLNWRTDNLGLNDDQFKQYLEDYAKELIDYEKDLARIGMKLLKPIMGGTWNSIGCISENNDCFGVPIPEKPRFIWHANDIDPKAIFNAEENLINDAINTKGFIGEAWEIGNEPNWFPLITPEQYAKIFELYYHKIKSEDPTAKVIMGSFFLIDLVKDDIENKVLNAMWGELSPVQAFALGITGYGDHIFGMIMEELKSHYFEYTTVEYFKAVMNKISVEPDIISLHVYPFDENNDLNTKSIINNVVAEITNVLNKPIWITEFGNIQNFKSEAEVADEQKELIEIFEKNPKIEKWFYFKAVGEDHSDPNPALTSLIKKNHWNETNYKYDQLNEVGKMYYWRSRAKIAPNIITPLLLNNKK